MTNAPSTISDRSSAPRRSSYASVAAGLAGTSQRQSQASTNQTVSLSDIMNPLPPPTPLSAPFLERTRRVDPESGTSSFLEHRRRMKKTMDASYYLGFGRMRQEVAWETGLSLPSYLRGSRYGVQLRSQQLRREQTPKEKTSMYHMNNGGSASSSSVSLPKLQPSTRGMTYDVIEPEVHLIDEVPSLPSRWSETDKNESLELHSEGHEVKYVPHGRNDYEAAAIRTDLHIPPACGVYYYEVTITSKGKDGIVSIGFSGAKAALEKLPGWEPDSWGFHSDDGKTFLCGGPGGKTYGDPYNSGDVIGCGINFKTNEAFFTKNGNYLGDAFRELKEIKLYPSVGMKRPDALLKANFGRREFLYDIKGYMNREIRSIKKEIDEEHVAALNPLPNNDVKDDVVLKAVISEYLSHECYTESAKAFAEDLKVEAASFGIPNHSQARLRDEVDDHHAITRQQIRDFIMDGDIDKALKRTHAYYPDVLRNNTKIYFQLKCRKFIEMLRHMAEILDLPNWEPSSKTATNGQSSNGEKDASSHRMDIDDQQEDINETSDAGDGDKEQQYHESLQRVLEYSQELKSEFQEQKPRYYHNTLAELFSLFAYSDPRTSPMSHLFGESGALAVAEELNSVILVSLGKNPVTAIETIYQQTEQLLTQLSKDGGPAAFVTSLMDEPDPFQRSILTWQ